MYTISLKTVQWCGVLGFAKTITSTTGEESLPFGFAAGRDTVMSASNGDREDFGRFVETFRFDSKNVDRVKPEEYAAKIEWLHSDMPITFNNWEELVEFFVGLTIVYSVLAYAEEQIQHHPAASKQERMLITSGSRAMNQALQVMAQQLAALGLEYEDLNRRVTQASMMFDYVRQMKGKGVVQ